MSAMETWDPCSETDIRGAKLKIEAWLPFTDFGIVTEKYISKHTQGDRMKKTEKQQFEQLEMKI